MDEAVLILLKQPNVYLRRKDRLIILGLKT